MKGGQTTVSGFRVWQTAVLNVSSVVVPAERNLLRNLGKSM